MESKQANEFTKINNLINKAYSKSRKLARDMRQSLRDDNIPEAQTCPLFRHVPSRILKATQAYLSGDHDPLLKMAGEKE